MKYYLKLDADHYFEPVGVNMAKKNKKDGYVLKSEVQLIIQNYIHVIQMNDYGNDNGIPQLYRVIDMIEKMPIKDSF